LTFNENQLLTFIVRGWNWASNRYCKFSLKAQAH